MTSLKRYATPAHASFPSTVTHRPGMSRPPATIGATCVLAENRPENVRLLCGCRKSGSARSAPANQASKRMAPGLRSGGTSATRFKEVTDGANVHRDRNAARVRRRRVGPNRQTGADYQAGSGQAHVVVRRYGNVRQL